jgi:dihydropteroate synthase
VAEAPGPLVMGVLNVTPDSFSDGGRFLDAHAAIAHGEQLVAEGAAIVDVGGESTRPGAVAVGAEEELRRVLPVIAALAPSVRVSIDTRKEVVARRAVDAGATVVNDVSASLHGVAASAGVGYVAMHKRGEPGTMQADPRYDDVVDEVGTFLAAAAERASAAGVGEVWIDPGIGFGKTAAHNLSLLRHLDRLVARGWPVVVGTSRKSFLGRLVVDGDGSDTGPDDRLEGSLATAAWAFSQGVAVVRAHDVAPTVDALRVVCQPVPGV